MSYTDEQIGDYWVKMSYSSESEPITESGNLDYIMNLLQAELLDGKDNGAEILELLRSGHRSYITTCIRIDGGQHEAACEELQGIDNEREFDDRERADDIRTTIARQAGIT